MDLGSGSRLTPCLDIGRVVLLRKCFRKLPLLGLAGLYLSAPCAKWSIHNLRLLPLRVGTVRPRSPPHSPERTSRSWKFCLLCPRQRPSPGRQHSPHLVLNSHPTQCRRAELWWLGRQWEGAGSWWLSPVSRWLLSAWLFITDWLTSHCIRWVAIWSLLKQILEFPVESNLSSSKFWKHED